MAIKDALLPEYDHEMATTRRLLDRVPEAEFAWKPHDKSYSLGALAAHLANIPTWTTAVVELETFDLSGVAADATPRFPTSRDGLLSMFDKNVADARAKITSKTDPELFTPWTLKKAGHVLLTVPRIAAIRSFVMNHSIHHRGQLSVYLRLRNVPLPMMYGPTADEAM
jgi:uncharacterized damage-inducible protein DinB